MESQELREKFLSFMEQSGHKRIPSYSVVPENDPSVLFTTAGMHPLVPFLMGESHPLGKRIVNSQKCLRTNDIDEVGDSSHLTFFEMLGYWSLGDYFKKESIKFTFVFYTNVLGFDKDKISVTVFEGDEDAPFDEESYNIWKNEIGIPEERIYKYNKKENWWGPASETGPCGPDTEMFLDTGLPKCSNSCGPACDCEKYIELGNNVFMEYFKNAEGKFEKLAQKNVDVGIGLERQVMFSQGKNSVYETDLFVDIVNKIKELSVDYSESKEKSVRIIADHLRAATFVLAEGVVPSNIDRGYITRRLIRRSVRHGRVLGINGNFTAKIAEAVIKKMSPVYPELIQKKDFIVEELTKEEEKFRKTLENGLEYLSKELSRLAKSGKGVENPTIADGIVNYDMKELGRLSFNMFQNHGFPLEMTKEYIDENIKFGMKVDLCLLDVYFKKAYEEHQEKSRQGAEKKFKGGLGDQSEQTVRYHTAAHLMLESLRRILGPHVTQRGANITQERLRFDFSHPDKLTEVQIKAVEEMVNDKISLGLPVNEFTTTVDDAKTNGATGIFDSKYGDQVKVYTVGGDLYTDEAFSKEICGGPHVKNTSELGKFKITKEESSSAGVRRIKAVLE